MPNEIDELLQFFKQYQIFLSSDWLTCCVEWCTKEILTNSYSRQELQNEIYKQWLVCDIRDLNTPSLSPDLDKHNYYVLQGNYCLQMLNAVDISRSKFSQLDIIQNSNRRVSVYEDKTQFSYGKRLLQLTLTDGNQEIKAIEYKPLNIGSNMLPGIKLRLLGPLTLRRGRILLDNNNVKVLGGEVEELFAEYSLENIFCKALGKPLSSKPQMGKPTYSNQIEFEPKPTVLSENSNMNSTLTEVPKNTASNANVATERDIKVFSVFENSRKTTTSINKRVDKKSTSNASTTLCNNASISNSGLSAFNEAFDDEIFENVNIDEHLNRNHITKPKEISPTPKFNIITLDKLLKNKEFITKGIFKVKARFKSVVQRLSMCKDSFTMTIEIEDDTCSATVRLDSELIAEFLQYCPAAMLRLKERNLENDENAKELLFKALNNTRNSLLKLDGVMEVRVCRNEELPTVLKLVKM